MTSRPLPRALVASAATLALLAPGTAYAATFRHTDSAHDVQQVDIRDQTTDTRLHGNADIVHVKVTHTPNGVVSEVRLRKYTGHQWSFFTTIKTPKRKYTVVVQRGRKQTTVQLSKNRTRFPIPCEGLGFQVRPGTGKVRAVVPETCLHKPRWVKVGVGWTVDSPADATVFVDDGLVKREATQSSLTLSRRIARG